MNPPTKFALIGKSGSGKSSAAQFLSAELSARHIKTGAICRQIALLLFGDEDKRSTQRLDDALTGIDPSIFLRAALRQVTPDESFILDALRFRADLNLAKEHGCRTIRIIAPDDVRFARLSTRGQVFDPVTDADHRSETELDEVPVDFEVKNDAGVSELKANLLKIIART